MKTAFWSIASIFLPRTHTYVIGELLIPLIPIEQGIVNSCAREGQRSHVCTENSIDHISCMKLLLFFSWMGARTHGGSLRYFAECVILIACYCSLCTHEIRFCSPTYIYFVWVVIWVGVDDVIQSKYTEALDYSLGVEVGGLNQTVTWIKFFWWRMCYYYYYKIIALCAAHAWWFSFLRWHVHKVQSEVLSGLHCQFERIWVCMNVYVLPPPSVAVPHQV